MSEDDIVSATDRKELPMPMYALRSDPTDDVSMGVSKLAPLVLKDSGFSRMFMQPFMDQDGRTHTTELPEMLQHGEPNYETESERLPFLHNGEAETDKSKYVELAPLKGMWTEDGRFSSEYGEKPAIELASSAVGQKRKAVPEVMETDRTEVARAQPVLPLANGRQQPSAEAKPSSVRRFDDGLSVALNRVGWAWEYLKAQAERFMQNGRQTEEDYQSAQQQLADNGINSDDALQKYIRTVERSDADDRQSKLDALQAVRNLRNSGTEWKDMQGALREYAEKAHRSEARIRDISESYAKLPQTEGAAKVADIGANVVGSALPLMLAIGLAPKAAPIVGAGVMAGDVANNMAQANMQVDAYERETGQKVPDLKRGAYVTARVATDFCMDVLFNSPALKKMMPDAVGKVSQKILEGICLNPVAQAEFNTMMRQVMSNERKAFGRETIKSAIGSGVASGMEEVETSIYTGDAPELKQILNSALSGAAWGGVVGGALSATRAHDIKRSREKNDQLYLVSNTDGEGPGNIPISEVRGLRLKGDDLTGNVRSSTDLGVRRKELDVEHISAGSFREAEKSGALKNLHKDNWDFSSRDFDELNARWRKADGLEEEQSDLAKNKVIQDIATRMGVPVRVYSEFNDLPDVVKRYPNARGLAAYTLQDNSIGIVLPNCRNMDVEDVVSLIRHEAVGHVGQRRLHPDVAGYNRERDRVGDAITRDVENGTELKGWTPHEHTDLGRYLVEERGALEAEGRKYLHRPYRKDGLGMLDDMLRRSEKNLRNTTYNELRKQNGFPGRPLPDMYDMEILELLQSIEKDRR